MLRVALAGFLAVALVGCSSTTAGSPVGRGTPTTATTTTATTTARPSTTSASATGKRCTFRKQGSAPQGRDVGTPPERAADKPATVTLTTNLGAIAITLTTDKTPCTTRSFAFLADKKYFDDTPCHRLTASPSLKVLQCGDPTGRGTAGPGYTVPDENPTDLAPAGTAARYPRGTVAMANTGQPNSGGSQFFLVHADSTLPPTYAVFGTVDDAGLTVLDKVAAGGITPQRGDEDGAPTVPIKIQRAVVGT
ncbi:peptidylprolyl isomerase [Actinokineospora sp.]|uniref:peptidylprolyl isomerase n=1 Tax=Actinokineospora sp. TaxID=1872133 RepID=UPI0040379EA7